MANSSGSTSQTPSCRALAGSLASFDASVVNTDGEAELILTRHYNLSSLSIEGVPLLEENEVETEGSNSSVSGGDTGSATYSETSSGKT